MRASARPNPDENVSAAAVAQARTSADLFALALSPATTSAQVPIDLTGSDLEGVAVSLTLGISIPIRLTIDGRELSSINGYDRIRIQLRPRATGGDSATQRGGFDGQGLSSVEGVQQGEYRIAVQSMSQPDLYLKEARFAGADVLDDPWRITNQTSGVLNIVLSVRGGQIQGNIVDATSRPANGIQVVIVPDRGRDRS